jgi:hypothetical protein
MILSFRKTWPDTGEPTNFEQLILAEKKIHTIREDPKRRWKPGMKIHFANGVRTPDYNQFQGGVCTCVQKITITHTGYGYDSEIYLNDNPLDIMSMTRIALNDGFPSLSRFLEWFNTDFTGYLIHWTPAHLGWPYYSKIHSHETKL